MSWLVVQKARSLKAWAATNPEEPALAALIFKKFT